jgi:3-oxo-5-alpha-steroid 4-dehydrogenase 1
MCAAGYKIPLGGAFTLVSAANYAGEILEWLGYAVAVAGAAASWRVALPATAFAAFTFCNLAPRGWQHHVWYQGKFEDYPKGRRAVIPFVW